jgi:hypothetical protein
MFMRLLFYKPKREAEFSGILAGSISWSSKVNRGVFWTGDRSPISPIPHPTVLRTCCRLCRHAKIPPQTPYSQATLTKIPKCIGKARCCYYGNYIEFARARKRFRSPALQVSSANRPKDDSLGSPFDVSRITTTLFYSSHWFPVRKYDPCFPPGRPRNCFRTAQLRFLVTAYPRRFVRIRSTFANRRTIAPFEVRPSRSNFCRLDSIQEKVEIPITAPALDPDNSALVRLSMSKTAGPSGV